MSLKINPALFNTKLFLYGFVIAALYGIVKGCSNEAPETILQTESTVSEIINLAIISTIIAWSMTPLKEEIVLVKF